MYWISMYRIYIPFAYLLYTRVLGVSGSFMQCMDKLNDGSFLYNIV